MAAEFPGTIATIPADKQDDTNAKTGVDEGTSSTVGVHAAHHNKLAEEVVAVQTELGADPAGPFATVKERIEARDFKRSCRAATTGALPAATLTGSGTILTANANGVLAAQDGVTLIVGDRFFVKDQTGADAPENGIYEVTSLGAAGAPWVLTRPTDANTAVKVSDAMYVAVEQGTQNRDSLWELVSDNPITLGTTALRFTRNHPAYVEPYASGQAGRLWLPAIGKMESPDTTAAALSNQAALSSGVSKLQVLGVVRAGDTISSLTFVSATTGGATLTNQWAYLVRCSDRVILGVSPTDGSTAWGANAAKTFVFGTGGTAGAPTTPAPWTADVDTLVWAGLMVAATTVPTVCGISAVTANVLGGSRAVLPYGTTGSAQTTPPAVGTTVATLSTSTTRAYVYAS